MKPKNDPSGLPPEILSSYAQLVATIPGLERKGATMPYTSLNGHMFSFLTKDGILALRLPTGMREVFLVKYATELVVANNTIMKEYIAVPANLLSNTFELSAYFAQSYRYVASLPPKPTKK